jgi:hypothetical protein
METKHTSGNWAFTVFAKHHILAGQPAALYVEHDGDDVDVAIFERVSEEYKGEQLANGEFIVRACNAFDALLKACELMEDLILHGLMPGPADLLMLQAAIAKTKEK